MTIREVINRVQAIKNPTPPEGELLQIINDTEYEIIRKIIAPRDEDYDFEEYDDSDMSTRLKAPRPFDNVYVVACVREINRRENQETLFNNSEREYKEIFGELAAWWKRTHRDASQNMTSCWFGV